MLRCCGAAVLLGIAALPVSSTAQEATRDSGAAYSMRLLTMGQGDQIWERFGHNALAVESANTGTRIAYNWGLFDFAQPGFLSRFLTGRTLYWMDGFDVGATLTAYGARDREVVGQDLALSAAQRSQLAEFLRWNALPDNKYYQYDYFLDNCSTRLRDAVDRVLGGAIKRQTDTVMSGTTFRSHTQRLLEENPLTYAGITIALGQPADREISAWEEMFLPVRLRDLLRNVQVDTGGGALVALVAREQPLFVSRRPPERREASTFVRYFLGVGVGLAVMLLLLGNVSHGSGRAAFATLASAWLAIGGILGVILALAWGTTRHVFWFRNENLFLLNPLLLVLAVMLPFALRASASERLRQRTLGLTRLITLLALFAVSAKALPWFYQRNWEVIALVLPAHLAVAAIVWRSLNPKLSS